MRARVVQSGTQSRDITDGHRGGVGGVGRIDAQIASVDTRSCDESGTQSNVSSY